MEISSITTVVLTVLGSGAAVIGLVYQIMRNFREDVKKDFDKLEKRLERQDQRIFMLSMGKDLAEILKSERQHK